MALGVGTYGVVLFFSFFFVSSTVHLTYAAFYLPTTATDDDCRLNSPRRSVSVAEVERSSPSRSRSLLTDSNSSLVLAAERTRRRDPLDGNKFYTGGWNISEYHYWTSVGFTAAPLFLVGAAWFLIFGTFLVSVYCYRLCFGRGGKNYSYSRMAYVCSLGWLILFTVAAGIGCVLLYSGGERFHESTIDTLDFVVAKADLTVKKLQNFSVSLAAARKIRVREFFLSQEDLSKIDELELEVKDSASKLSTSADSNSKDIQNLLDLVRLVLIILGAVTTLLVFLGLAFSILGLHLVVKILAIIGWILVTAAFLLGGVFLILNNVVGDTCVAMDDWVGNPHANTALDEILPCVDSETAKETLDQSKRIVVDIVNGINQIITQVVNVDSPPPYNQSGPFLPQLCSPRPASDSDQCASNHVTIDNASEVWLDYICRDISKQICTSVGRITPDIYDQLSASLNVSSGLLNYSPFLVSLVNCTFVREAFRDISKNNCPELKRYSSWVYLGLTMVSTAVMLSLILWVVYAREKRHRMNSRRSITLPSTPRDEPNDGEAYVHE